MLAVSCVGLFLLVSSLTSLNVALPQLRTDLGAGPAALQWIVDAYAVVFGGLLLTGGALGDRIGRRAALLGRFALVAAAGVGGAVAAGTPAVIGARAVNGLGAALMMPATLSALTEVFEPAEHRRAIAIWSGIAGAGGAVGPLLGGWLLEIAGWRSVFVMTAVVAAVGAVATVAWVPELAGRRQGRLDPIGAVLSTTAIGLFLFALIEAPAGWSRPSVLLVGLAGLVLGFVFVSHERRCVEPMLPLEVLAPRRVRVGAATLILAAVGFAGVIFVGSLLLQIGWEERPLTTGLLLVPIGVAELAISMRSVRLAERFGAGNVVAVGLVVMASGYLLMAATPVGSRLLFVFAGVVAGLGNGLVIPPSVERVVGGAEPDLAGITAGVNEASVELGAALGVAVLGGVQRVVYRWLLPAGVPAEPLDAALTIGDRATVLGAFRGGGRAALVAAALAALVAVGPARTRLDGDPGPGDGTGGRIS